MYDGSTQCSTYKYCTRGLLGSDFGTRCSVCYYGCIDSKLIVDIDVHNVSVLWIISSYGPKIHLKTTSLDTQYIILKSNDLAKHTNIQIGIFPFACLSLKPGFKKSPREQTLQSYTSQEQDAGKSQGLFPAV